eukprot:1635315-Pyramimonas_sp.AAC.2
MDCLLSRSSIVVTSESTSESISESGVDGLQGTGEGGPDMAGMRAAQTGNYGYLPNPQVADPTRNQGRRVRIRRIHSASLQAETDPRFASDTQGLPTVATPVNWRCVRNYRRLRGEGQ